MRFRSVPHLPFGQDQDVRPNVLRFGLEPESLSVDLTATGSRPETLTQLSLTARMDTPDLPAYGRLLLDVLRGDPALSIRGDEAEEAWRVVEPVLSAWERGLVPLEEYPAARTGRRRATPRPSGGTTCCTRSRSCGPSERPPTTTPACRPGRLKDRHVPVRTARSRSVTVSRQLPKSACPSASIQRRKALPNATVASCATSSAVSASTWRRTRRPGPPG